MERRAPRKVPAGIGKSSRADAKERVEKAETSDARSLRSDGRLRRLSSSAPVARGSKSAAAVMYSEEGLYGGQCA